MYAACLLDQTFLTIVFGWRKEFQFHARDCGGWGMTKTIRPYKRLGGIDDVAVEETGLIQMLSRLRALF